MRGILAIPVRISFDGAAIDGGVSPADKAEAYEFLHHTFEQPTHCVAIGKAAMPVL